MPSKYDEEPGDRMFGRKPATKEELSPKDGNAYFEQLAILGADLDEVRAAAYVEIRKYLRLLFPVLAEDENLLIAATNGYMRTGRVWVQRTIDSTP